MAASFLYERNPGVIEEVGIADGESKIVINGKEILIFTDVSNPSPDALLTVPHAEAIPALYDNEVLNEDPHYVPVYVFENTNPYNFSPTVTEFRYLGPTGE